MTKPPAAERARLTLELSKEDVRRDIEELGWGACRVGSVLSIRAGPVPLATMPPGSASVLGASSLMSPPAAPGVWGKRKQRTPRGSGSVLGASSLMSPKKIIHFRNSHRFGVPRLQQQTAMAQGPMEGELMSGDPISKLTDDILVDIISRVPYKSTCCCKCVSTRWRDFFSHPDHRKKLPQPLAGFFHDGYNNQFPKTTRYFTNLSGEGDPLVDPSLSFLPPYQSLDILDCCNGLLLCRCWKATDRKKLDYVVCNPATEKWVVVPATDWSSKVNVARLGFEPAVSSHFHVFEFIDEDAWGIVERRCDVDGRIETLAIYSSKAGVWTHQILDELEFAIPTHSRGVFLDGVLHLATSYKYFAAVDVEGIDWQFIDNPVPAFSDDAHGDDIFVSQGQLHLTNIYAGSGGSQLSVWTLEDYVEEWTLKHNVSHLELFGERYSPLENLYSVISFHPEHNMIFIVFGHENTLMSYDMDRKKLCFLRQLGRDCQIQWGKTPCLPYVPLFSETLADG